MARQSPRVSMPLILVADDSVETQELYAEYFKTCGFNVDVASDGREALRKARTRRPDIIVMDLQMPHLDGWGAINELRSRPDTAVIPVIVLTGHDFKHELKPAALAAGACSFVTKPVIPDHLLREIQVRLAQQARPPASA